MANRIQADGLVTRVEVAGAGTVGGPVAVTFTVSNPTGGPRTFCDYHTPLEGVRNDIFIITASDGAELEYRGIMAKRRPPGDDDHVTLAPGEERSAVVDIADSYELTAGTYSLRFRGSDICGLPDSDAIDLAIKD